MFHELSGTPLTHPPTVHENLAVTTGWAYLLGRVKLPGWPNLSNDLTDISQLEF